MCGIGVTSRIIVTRRPAAWSARSADSRPAPGPFTYTPTVRMPFSIAFFAHSSAATCAANGVDLREPLKPACPDVAHATALPPTSVIVMIVLLKVAWMWTTPVGMFFLTFFLTCFFAAMCVPSRYFFVACFLPATVFFGPLRVRALVCVRCPRTGRPRRWRSPR